MKRTLLNLDTHIETQLESKLDDYVDAQIKGSTASIFNSPAKYAMYTSVFSPIANKLRVQIYHNLKLQLKDER